MPDLLNGLKKISEKNPVSFEISRAIRTTTKLIHTGDSKLDLIED